MNGPLLLAFTLPLPVLALQWGLWPWISPYVWFLFYPTVFFSARLAGFKAGILSTLFSIAMVWYFFMPPQLSWKVENPAGFFSAALFLLMGYLFSSTHEYLFQARRGSETALTEIFELAAVGITMVSLDGCWLRADPRTERLPVVILTSSDDERDRLRGYENGCISFAHKPVNFADFAETVARLGISWLAANEPLQG